jgi:hypothetical protein
MTEDDNLSIGILFCTKKSYVKGSIVDYALAGMDNQLFISRYAVVLPKKEDMKNFLNKYNRIE